MQIIGIGYKKINIGRSVNRMHQIPVHTIIVYIKTNTIAIITLKSIKCSIVLGGVLLFFLCFFLFCREDYNGITEFHRKYIYIFL